MDHAERTHDVGYDLGVERGIVIRRDEVPVMFSRFADEPTAIARGWAEFEEVVGSPRGRRFYGAFDEAVGEYLACVQLREDDDPDALGLERGTLAGGRYLRVRLHGEPPGLYDRIAPTFELMTRRPDADPSRPGIEFYRRH